ncbi:MAG: SpoIIE family protein phosphatase, partial [Terracidiphilus sp.]
MPCCRCTLPAIGLSGSGRITPNRCHRNGRHHDLLGDGALLKVETVGRLFSKRHSLLLLAALLTLAVAVYSFIWAYYIRSLPQSRIGVVLRQYSSEEKQLDLVRVSTGSPAERAGLRPGDHIAEINGQPLDSIEPWIDSVVWAKPNSPVVFTLKRGSEAAFQRTVITPDLPRELIHPTFFQVVVMNSLLSYPLFFLGVGMAVLWFRPLDRNAWLLAIMFTGFIALAPFVNSETEPLVPVAIRRFALTFQFVFQALFPAIFYYFFAVFPVPSPLDRRVPWLKFALLGTTALIELPLAWTVATTGSMATIFQVTEWIKGWFDPTPVSTGYLVGALCLGLVSLAWNGWRAPTVEAKRKIRVLALGTAAGLVPMLGMTVYVLQSGKEVSPLSLPFYLWIFNVAALILVPLSFAYAVVKHRVMDIPVLLKRSARYLLVRRGFALFITIASIGAAWAFVRFFFQFFPWLRETGSGAVVTVGMAGAGVGGLIAVGTSRIQDRVRHRLDRAFFRGQYDARQILEDLAERIRKVQKTTQLAALLEEQITKALNPSALTLYVEVADGVLQTSADGVRSDLHRLTTEHPLLKEIARRGQPVDVPPPDSDLFKPFSMIEPLRCECIVPLPARDGGLVGVIVLGPRLSEEPYSEEDKRLLSSVANQAGVAIESIRLAEKMAAQLVAERRTAYESEMARQVQARLLPQRAPVMQTLDYAGVCIQARAVGGDYYDFLDVGAGRIAIVLADVSGKGMPAALLMAGLQATMRTHCTAGRDNLATMMRQVNKLLYESTAPQHFVTLFVAEYDDASHRLQFVNCGHNPPILLTRSGIVQRLCATACVLGAFPQWECTVEEVTMNLGDTVALFTDGVTEAANKEGEEFGEERLIAALCEHRGQPADQTLEAVTRLALAFGGSDQADDLTMIVARVVEMPGTAATDGARE